MSLRVEVSINNHLIAEVVIERRNGDGVDHDSVYEYDYRYMRRGKCLKSGSFMHRYGDGVMALAAGALKRCKELTAAPRKADS